MEEWTFQECWRHRGGAALQRRVKRLERNGALAPVAVPGNIPDPQGRATLAQRFSAGKSGKS